MASEETATEKPTGLAFSLKPRKKKPARRYRKGSKYDPLLKQFMESENNMVEVSVEGKDGNYLRTQFNKRLEPLGIADKVEVSVANGICYLEKIG